MGAAANPNTSPWFGYLSSSKDSAEGQRTRCTLFSSARSMRLGHVSVFPETKKTALLAALLQINRTPRFTQAVLLSCQSPLSSPLYTPHFDMISPSIWLVMTSIHVIRPEIINGIIILRNYDLWNIWIRIDEHHGLVSVFCTPDSVHTPASSVLAFLWEWTAASPSMSSMMRPDIDSIPTSRPKMKIALSIIVAR